MSLNLIHPHHIAHLARSVGFDEKLIAKVNRLDREARIEVLQKIEEAQPGTIERLDREWAAYSSQALHLWKAPLFEYVDADQLKGLIERNHSETFTLGQTKRFEDPYSGDGEGFYVNTICLTKDRLAAEVKHHFFRKVHFRESYERYPTDSSCEVVINLDREDRLIEAYATYQLANGAVEELVRWCTGSAPVRRRLKKKNDDVESIVPVDFDEWRIKALAEKKGWKRCGLDGPDGKGNLSNVRYEGDPGDTLFEGDERVRAQEGVSHNSLKYWVTYQHPEDGFQLDGPVEFYFKGSQPHMTFTKKTTRSFKAYVLDALLKELAG